MNTVRKATAGDIQTIAQFNQAMSLETESKSLPSELIIPGVTYLVEHPDAGFYLVAETNGQLSGCLGITYEWSDWRNALFWWIQSVYVATDFRRHGVFTSMYEHVTALAKQDNACGLRLYVEKENTQAQATYKKLDMFETHYRLMEIEF